MKPTRLILAIPILSALALAGCSSTTSSAPTTSTTGRPTSSSSGSGATATTSRSTSSLPESCPTAATVSAALGSTYPSPRTSGGGGLVSCNYSDPSTSVNAVLGFSKATGITDAALKSTADSQAQAQGVTASPVSGLGDVAYRFTQNDASTNASGVATTVLLIKVGSVLVDITAEATPAQVEALGHVLVK